MFHGPLPDSYSERLALLDVCLERWFGPANAPASVPEATLTQAEQRLALALPAALRDWYQRSGLRRDVWCLQDRLLAPADFEWRADVLVFCAENQGVVRWGIPRDALSLPDPPVVVSDPWNPAKWLPECERISEFALVFAAMNTKWSRRVAYRADVELSPDVLSSLQDSLTRLPLPDLHFPAFPTRFFGDDNALVEVQGKVWAWVSAQTDEAFEQIDEIVQQAGGEPLELAE